MGSEPVVPDTKVGYIVTAVTSSLAIEILAEVAEDKAVVASPVTFPTSGPANPAAFSTPDCGTYCSLVLLDLIA